MSGHTRRLGLMTFAAVALVFLSPAAARAQTSASSAARAAARADAEMRQRMLWELDKINREKPARAPDVRPAYGDVAEEFKQLQLVNYSLSGTADPKAGLDYARVRKESAELRKRASRLKGYLLLPEAGPDGKRDKAAEIQTPEALRSAVKKLDELVRSFVWNPVFQKPDVVDLELSTKASRDLAGILTLSEQVHKSAEELGKSLAKK
jgi:hypothetical protein